MSTTSNEKWVKPPAPLILPAGWKAIPPPADNQRSYLRNDGLYVIMSANREADGRMWLHVSCSRRGFLPSWQDLREMKDVFIGREKTAIQVLPPESEYVNVHPFVLHLWSCLDGAVIPDFRHDGVI